MKLKEDRPLQFPPTSSSVILNFKQKPYMIEQQELTMTNPTIMLLPDSIENDD
jgi:hypothetical protein